MDLLIVVMTAALLPFIAIGAAVVFLAIVTIFIELYNDYKNKKEFKKYEENEKNKEREEK